jgi:hypothetical protein
VDGFVFNLFLGSAHKVADSCFSIFSPVSFYIIDLHVKKSAVEAVEKWHQEVLLALEPKVAVSIVVAPSIGSCLSKHEEVFCAGNEPEGNESSEED